MSKVIGIMACNYRNDLFRGITKERPVAAIPFGGRYRLMDFALSSMVNSGLRTVGIITPYVYRPILDHMGAGKDWYLDRKTGGMFVLPGSKTYPKGNKFGLKDLIQNIVFLERDDADYVIMSGCNNIFNLDYREVLRNHQETGADLTMMYKELVLEAEEDDQGVVLKLDDYSRVIGIESARHQTEESVKYFADILIIGREFLLDMLKVYQYIDEMDFIEVLEENVSKLRIVGAPIASYFGRVFSIPSYFQRSMDMLNPVIRDELFMGNLPIHTKIKDNPPTKYGAQSSIQDALVSSGCMIHGNINHSIVFRGVKVAPDAHISNSIIMQGCVIGEGAVLDNVILDKFGSINMKVVIKGDNDAPVVLSKSTTV